MSRNNPLLTGAPSLEAMLANVAADIVQPRPEQTDTWTSLAENSLYQFAKQSWPVLEPARPFVDGWHIGCIAEHLQALEGLEIRNLIINIPPRHMKSILAGVAFFSWAWIRQPSSQWIYCAYGEKLAERDSNKCRDLIQSQWYQARWGHIFRLKRSQNASERFANDRQGYRIATTIAGKAMGEGGDFLIYDDPHKPQEVRSEAHRLAVIDSWQKTMSTRGNDPKTVRKLLVMQRLHERDLTGYLLAERGGYEHLCYDRTTEVLTPAGWVRFDRLEQGAPVAQVDPATLEMTWAVPTGYVRYRYDGPVYHYQSTCLDLLVTPDHRMIYKDPNDFSRGDKLLDWRVRAAASLPQNFYIPQAVRWNAPDVATVRFAGRDWDGDDFCRFVGAWLSEGCTRRGKNDVVVSQDLGEFHNAIWDLLRRLPVYFWRTPQGPKRPNHIHFVSCDKDLFAALRPFGRSGDKYVPAVIKGMSARQIGIFLDWYGRGDGHRLKKNDAQTQYVSKSRRLIDDVQELLVRVGRCGGLQVHPGCFRIQNRVDKNGDDKHYGRVAPNNVRVEPFADDVFCVSVPTGALLVRRNGKTAVSGNCLPAEYEPKRYWFLGAHGDDGAGQRGEFRASSENPSKARPRDVITPTSLQRQRPELLDGPTGSGRKEEGDLLWREQFGPEEIQTLKGDLEGTGWAGQGQQRPAPVEGSIFRGEFFRRFTLQTSAEGEETISLPQGEGREPLTVPVWRLRFYQVVDTALSAKDTANYTAVVTFAYDRPTRNLLVWHVFRQRLMVHEQLPSIFELRDGAGFWDVGSRRWSLAGKFRPWPNPVMFQAVENKASGQGLIDESIAQGKPLRAVSPGSQDKVQRAAAAVTLYGAGRVWHKGESTWLTDLEDELLSFPTGAYSDQVDCIAYGARLAAEEEILNADIDGDLLMPSPRNPDGTRMTLADLRAAEAGVEVLNVGGHLVEFPEDVDDFGQ